MPLVQRTPEESGKGEENAGSSRTLKPSDIPSGAAPVTRRSFPAIFGGAFFKSPPAPPSDTTKSTRRSSTRSANASTPAPSVAEGHEGNLTKQQQQILEAFTKELVENKIISLENAPPYQTTQLLRFLRARSFDKKASMEMYLRTEEWRKKIDMDRLYEEFSFTERDQVARYGWRMYFHKTDRIGRPVFIQDLSGLDTEKVFSVTTADRIVQNFAVTLEHAVRERYLACTASTGRTVDDNLMILNVQGLGLSTFWSMKNKLQELLAILDNNFPELSGRVQIINAPMLFTTIWSCIKGWLPTQTAEKIDICDSDYMPKIRALVDMQNWPKHLGGACTCGGDGCVGDDDNDALETRPACETSDSGPWSKQPGL